MQIPSFILGYSVHFSLHLVFHGFDFGSLQTSLTSTFCLYFQIWKLKLFWRELKCFLCSWELSSHQVWGLYTALLCYSHLTVLELTRKLEYFPPFCHHPKTVKTNKIMTWNWSPSHSEEDKFLLVLPMTPWLVGVKVFSFSVPFSPFLSHPQISLCITPPATKSCSSNSFSLSVCVLTEQRSWRTLGLAVE